MPKENPQKTEKLKNLLSIFEGRTPVYFYYEDTKKYDFLGMDYLTSINQPMTNELKHIFGDDNVVVREWNNPATRFSWVAGRFLCYFLAVFKVFVM